MELMVDIEKKLNGFNLKVNFHSYGEVLGLLGASGSGKSMTLRCIAGLEKPTSGKITLNDKVLYDSEKRICVPARKRKVGFLFQNYALFPNMTVAQNIGFALEGISKSTREEKIREKISMMHLNGLENRYPSQLSGGQQQRVALARALAVDPEMLLLDEPFSALDNHLRSQMESQLLEILADYKGVAFFVTHNMDEAYRVCEKLVILSNGRVAAWGDKDRIFQDPPSFAAAQLTGCKNISEARLGEEGLIEAVEWGCRLKVDKTIPWNNVSYVGIRARHIRGVKDGNVGMNIFGCRLAKMVEGPHSVTLYVDLEVQTDSQKRKHIHWEVSKERWLELKDTPQPWFVELSPEKLFVIQ